MRRSQPEARGRPFRPQAPLEDALDQRGPHHGHGHGPGFSPGFAAGFGPGGPRRGRRGWGGPRPRGDVRAAILLLLDEQPRHGYELIGEITDRSGGVWTPSPGSIYPTLQALEDEGLIRLEKVEGRRTASLTEAGSAWVADHRSELGDPFDIGGPPAAALDLRRELGTLTSAVGQVARVATAAQMDRAAQALASARKEIYRLLAEDEDIVDD